MRKFSIIIVVLSAFLLLLYCGGGNDSGGDGDDDDNDNDDNNDNNDSSGEIDRSGLPEEPPDFTYSPFYYPNDVETDLETFGIYNVTSDCDIVHIGWDFYPTWSSYPDNQVPVVAVADGIISFVLLNNTNTYDGQEHNTYIVWLAVSQDVDVQYTFEPFLTLDETEASAWLNVELGDEVSAGDTIGYLPKVEGNIGDSLIHIDFKIGINSGSEDYSYVCPTDYFSEGWQDANTAILLGKIITACPAICIE